MSAHEGRIVGLRERQQIATGEEIIQKAMELVVAGEESVSHELIARATGMSTRTVYRHFPDRVSLMQAIWWRLREITKIRFPQAEDEIVPEARRAFTSLNEHATLVDAVMASIAGAKLQTLPAGEGVAAFSKSLGPLLKGFPASERKLIVAAFTAIYSAPFWQLLRQRGGLAGDEVQESTAWLIETLLSALHDRDNQSKGKKKNK